MYQTLSRSGEDVSHYAIGAFGDARLARVGALLFKRISEKLTICIRTLGINRATEVAFNRFLENKKTSIDTIVTELAKKTDEACQGKSHVLCLQDTVQLTYPSQRIKKSCFGPTSDSETKGLFVHPGVIVDAANRDVLGISSVISWCRDEVGIRQEKPRTIEEKESIRWIDTAIKTRENITQADMITVVGDRESDIFEVFERVPDERTQVLVRASHDRVLDSGEQISSCLSQIESAGEYEIELPRITGKRKSRDAILEIKYTPISIQKAGCEEPVGVFCVYAHEISSVPKGETPISWVLLTTHSVTSLKKAIQILKWYTWRWVIEQIFRTMKNKGLKIEESQIQAPKKLQVLSILSIATAIKIMSLVESRDGENNRAASDLFTKEEVSLLFLICKKLEGKTQKQKNPYNKSTMGWAAWVIARLGGWNGYASESPPGPCVMLRGLQKFELQYEGWLLAQ